MFNVPDNKANFNKLELALLDWWKKENILNKSIDQRPKNNPRTFYDGPITANGDPHHGHMLTFAMKDVIPRYWSMKGFRVERSLGWDCQGLPVEYEVEKQLGFKEKNDIAEYGIAKFNAKCRALVTDKRQQIIDLEERMGRLTNQREEYATMDASYIESVWWSLKELYSKGLLYEGFKVVPYSTRAGTLLSAAEVALGGYKPVIDPSITVMFELLETPNTYLLAWTTTPWTIPTNLALAVGKGIDYIQIEQGGKKYILAEELVDKYFSGKYSTKPVDISKYIGAKYKPPFKHFQQAKSHVVTWGHHVTTENGTGIVHLAPYGAEDLEILSQLGIEVMDVLNDQGEFTTDVPEVAHKFYRDANPIIVDLLKQTNILFKHEDYEHDMPMCWRTDTPLIYKPITSWYIAMSTLRKELKENNDGVNWVPSHMKDGRFGNWLSEVKDWGISRSRYWGTPLPIWKSDSGDVKVIGSLGELEELSGQKIEDPHRPFVDAIKLKIDEKVYTRVPDVIDVWYDSGAMPFARLHYPFENNKEFDKKFPAEYISESVDQTRGWFYSLMAINTALFGQSPYKNVVVSGMATDENGKKLSKSKKNYESPNEMIAQFGADSIRLNFFDSPISHGEDAAITAETLKLKHQEFMLPLWNIYKYFVTYANMHEWIPKVEFAYNSRNVWDDEHPWDHIPVDSPGNELDAWILAVLQNSIGEITAQFDVYQLSKVVGELKSLLDSISRWYIRRSRERFAAGDPMALTVLYYTLIEFCKLAAPIAPYITEEIYRNLVANNFTNLPKSIHLTDYPVVDTAYLDQNRKLLSEMELVRQVAELGQTIRTTNGLKVRQPLSLLEIELSTEHDLAGDGIVPWMKNLLADELNVKQVLEVPKVAATETKLEAANPKNGIRITLESKLTPELLEEGLLRELIRQIQNFRKQQKLAMGDIIQLYYSAPPEIEKLITKRKTEIMEAISASTLEAGDGEYELKVNEYKLKVDLKPT